MNFTIGTDPEFGVIYKNQFKSAIQFLPHKDHPLKKRDNAFYFDNVLAEIGLKPTNSKEKFILAIQDAFQDLKELLIPNQLTIQASMQYPSCELKHEEAIKAGCDPEVSAYSLSEIEPNSEYIIKDEDTDYMKHVTSFRTCGGHIHLGSEHLCLQNGVLATYVVKMLDLFLAIPELFFNKDKTTKDRRRVYGVAGSHRPKSYGVEYRALSNYWLSSPVYASLIYDICQFVLNFVEEGAHRRFWHIDEKLLDADPVNAHHCIGYNLDLFREAIDTVNLELAEPFLLILMNYLPNNIIRDFEIATKYTPKDLYEEWKI